MTYTENKLTRSEMITIATNSIHAGGEVSEIDAILTPDRLIYDLESGAFSTSRLTPSSDNTSILWELDIDTDSPIRMVKDLRDGECFCWLMRVAVYGETLSFTRCETGALYDC